MRKTLKTIYDAATLFGFLFGIGGIGGALDNGTSIVIPGIIFLASIAMLILGGKCDEVKIHDCTNNRNDIRLKYLP